MNGLIATSQPSLPFAGLTGWDYAIIIAYALILGSVGILCRRLNTDPSAYFRGGGNMLWWVGGVSALSTGISTWTFTGGAAKSYLDGLVYPLTLFLGVVPAVFALWFLAPRFRRMRVITSMEAVFRRFGLGTEQFYTWFTLPMGLFWGGIGLNTIGVFMGAIFGLDLAWTILIFGILLTFVAVLGGQWAISFFAVVQGALLVLVVLVVALGAVFHPAIGGPENLANVLPARHLDFGAEASAALVWLWIIWNAVFWTLNQMDLRNSGKFVRVKDDGSARKMVLLMMLPMLVLPFLMQLPAICAAVLYPDLSAVFPQLKRPEEGAWLAMALTILPQGLVGLMVCTMFGAAADSTDAALNANAGFFTRNVYVRYLRPAASLKNQVLVGKLVTAFFGMITVGVGLAVNSLRELNLFDLFQILNAMLLPPMIVPMVLGIFFRRTPDWSGWSTVLVGLLAAVLAQAMYSADAVQRLFGIARDLSERETVDSQFLFISAVTWGVSILWFFGTSLFLGKSKASHLARVDALFVDLAKPVDHLGEGGENQDNMQYRLVGTLALVTGSMILLGALIPNALGGRLSFVLIGGVIALLGLGLLGLSHRGKAN